MIKHLLKNYKKDEVLNLTHKELNVYPDIREDDDYQKIVENYLGRLSKEQRDKIKVIVGHLLPFGIHKYFSRKARYLTLIRDPAKRTLSFYNYYRNLYENENKASKRKALYKTMLLVNGKLPSFAEWFRVKYANPNSSFVLRPMHDYFKRLGYLSKPGNIFHHFFFVGITEKSEDDLAYLYGLLGINKFFVNQNVSKKYVRAFASKDKFDYQLYCQALKANADFKKHHPEYQPMVRRVKTKRLILTPFTQVIFDFKETLHLLSAKIREKSKLYSKIVDVLKRK